MQIAEPSTHTQAKPSKTGIVYTYIVVNTQPWPMTFFF